MFYDLLEYGNEVGYQSLVSHDLTSLEFFMVEIEGSSNDTRFLIHEASPSSFIELRIGDTGGAHQLNLLEDHKALLIDM